MDAADLVTRLREHRTIGGAPLPELQWLAAHGTLRTLQPGEIAARKGEPLDSLWITLSGHYAFYQDRGLGTRKVLDWRAGDVGGMLPYSRMTSSPGEARVIEPSTILLVHQDHFPELIRECPRVTALLVHRMLDRARAFTSNDLQDEKMASLGRISAGLAHELNNPASAAARGARLLSAALEEAEQTSRAIAAAGLGEAAFRAIQALRGACADTTSLLTPMERADREDAIAAWLEDRGADAVAAAPLVDAGATLETLEGLSEAVHARELPLAVRWITVWCTIRALTADIDRAATRIHDLVGAVKRITFMDRHGAQPVDLAQGLQDTIALLAHKARSRSITLALDVEPDLPPVSAIGSDLNQVWSNLIDNAIDAAPESGHVTVGARRQLDYVIVTVADDGPGIPPDVRDKIFDPFFTTKPVGQGTGMGLDIARRLAYRNGGDIQADSQPGRTEFRVSLPVAGAATPAR